jgi:hypothetical protein
MDQRKIFSHEQFGENNYIFNKKQLDIIHIYI